LSVDEALKIALQIAEALEAAPLTLVALLLGAGARRNKRLSVKPVHTAGTGRSSCGPRACAAQRAAVPALA